jgi:hypothetical protein
MSLPRRDSAAGAAYLDVQNKARREKQSTQTLLTLYALERFLARIEHSPYADSLVLKGGMLMAVWQARRATKDADFLAQNQAFDQQSILDAIAHICGVVMDRDDGVEFHPEQAQVRTIRDDAQYCGVSVTFPAQINRAVVKIKVEVSVGDPVIPPPDLVQYPTLREGFPPVRLRAYPQTVMLAEKICTAIEKGETNSRVRDYVDVWNLTGLHSFVGAQFAQSLKATASYRQVRLRPLHEVIGDLATIRAGTYRAYRRALGVEVIPLPDDFAQLLADVATFADPVLSGALVEAAVWDPQARCWSNARQ